MENGEKKCETCRYWHRRGKRSGTCLYILPDFPWWVGVDIDVDSDNRTGPNNGRFCHTWQEREVV